MVSKSVTRKLQPFVLERRVPRLAHNPWQTHRLGILFWGRLAPEKKWFVGHEIQGEDKLAKMSMSNDIKLRKAIQLHYPSGGKKKYYPFRTLAKYSLG